MLILMLLLRMLILMIVNYCCFAVVGLSFTDLSREYFGRRFNQQPIIIFNIPEPSNTGKALVEFFQDMKRLSLRGLYIQDFERGPCIHKPVLKGHLADALAR